MIGFFLENLVLSLICAAIIISSAIWAYRREKSLGSGKEILWAIFILVGWIPFFIFYVDKSIKWSITKSLALALPLILIMFPYSDLTDSLTRLVYNATAKQVFLQTENIRFNPLKASVTFEKNLIETTTFSTSVDSLSATPSITALIQGKPGGHFSAQGFLKGEIKISLSPAGGSSGKSDTKDGAAKADKYNVDLNAQNLSLKEIKEMTGLSLPIKGQLSISTQAVADIAFLEQPEGEISLTINKFELPASSVALADMGRVNLPEIKLSQIELKGKLSNGKFVIETGKIGNSKDDFHGDIKGDMSLTLQNMGGQIVPLIGAYSLSFDLKANTAFEERAKFFLSFLGGYKRELPDGAQYKFRIQAQAMGMPPQFTQLQ